jgi:DNA-binding protein YbaB
MDKAMDESIRRVSELLEAHQAAGQEFSETAAAIVTATVDSRLQLTKVDLHDKSLDPAARAELERAIIAAVNGARIKAVKSAGESLGALRESPEWKQTMDQIFKRGQAAS